ncbi:MAG: SMC-Scp complex subunit ScpB [Cyanobacteria bacterium P01_A01_bin.45]
MNFASTIEAILYLKGTPLSLSEIADYAACDRSKAQESIIELIDDYARRESALEVVKTSKGYTLQLRSDFHELVNTLIPVELGVGALRTLAAIALNEPIIQSDLITVRGSGAYQHVQELVEQGFIKKRRDSESRSYSIQVTPKFHQYFQIEQLPQGVSLSPKEKQLELNLDSEFDIELNSEVPKMATVAEEG